MDNQEPIKKKIGRPKGSFSSEKVDLQNILRLNAPYILERAVTLATSKPEKFQPLLMKLIDKITPNLNVNTNINVSSDFEGKLIDVLSRANQLREPQQVEIIPHNEVTLLNKEESSNEKTESYIETVQPKEDNLNDQLNKAFEKKDVQGGISDAGGGMPE